MDPVRISQAGHLSGPSTTRQVDLQQPVKQVQQEDQVQFSAESEQVAELKSGMDVTVDRQGSRVVGRRDQGTGEKIAGAEMAAEKDCQRETGNRLDVEG